MSEPSSQGNMIFHLPASTNKIKTHARNTMAGRQFTFRPYSGRPQVKEYYDPVHLDVCRHHLPLADPGSG